MAGRLEVGLWPWLALSLFCGSRLTFLQACFPSLIILLQGQRPAWLISAYGTGQVVVAAAAGGGDVGREGSSLPSGDAGSRTHVS